jgi:hypothetical protein
MPAQKISELEAVGTVDGTEQTVYIKGGQARRATVSEVNAALNAVVQTVQEQIAQLQNPTLPNLATLPGIVPPNKVGPFTDAGVEYPTLAEYYPYLSQKAGSGGSGGPSAPVVNAAPSLSFPGGTGDTGENATYTQGTYTGGTVTSRDVQLVVNGQVFGAAIVGISNGASIQVPNEAGEGARTFGIIERANWAGGPAVTNPSLLYNINAPAAAPVQATAPSISPTTAGETTLLSATPGTYTVNGAPIDNSLLTLAEKWTIDFGLTGSLGASATAANLSAVWPLTTGSFPIIFSNGDEFSGTFTQGAAGITWSTPLTGSASATIKVVVVADDPTLQLQPANVDHAVRFREQATGVGGPSVWYEASNFVTPAASGGGGGAPGVSWTGLSGGQWTEILNRAAVIGGSSIATTAQNDVSSIPTSGGVTINPGANVRSTVAANTRVFLTEGTYDITAGGWMDWRNKEIIGVAGAVVVINLALSFADNRYYTVVTGNTKLINVRFVNAESSTFFDYGNSFYFNVLSDKPGYNITRATDGRGITVNGNGSRFVSCEFRFGFSHGAGSLFTGTYGGNASGGDADGIACRGGNNFFADVHALRNSDDGIDLWEAAGSNHFYFSSATYNGFNTDFPSGSTWNNGQQGDGNGFKWGIGSVEHHAYKCIMANNRQWGNNLNGQTVLPNLNLCSGSGNGRGYQSW